MRSYLLLAALAISTQLGCGASAPPFNYSKEPDPRNKPYRLGVGDRVRVSVWQHNDLSAEVAVRLDGMLTMPLVGDIQARGLTTAELQDAVKKSLAGYLKDPGISVTITVAEVVSYRYTVVGNVGTPGGFSPGRYVTIMEAIALAGGLSRFAEPTGIMIHRWDAKGKLRRIPIDYSKLLRGRAIQQNIVILPGDLIVVP